MESLFGIALVACHRLLPLLGVRLGIQNATRIGTSHPCGAIEARQGRVGNRPALQPIGCMSFYHPMRYKLSIVESPTRTDIPLNSEDENVSCSHQQMINHHGSGLLSRLSETHIWRHFGRERCQGSIASIKTTAASVGGE